MTRQWFYCKRCDENPNANAHAMEARAHVFDGDVTYMCFTCEREAQLVDRPEPNQAKVSISKCEDLRRLIKLLARRVDVLEARPIAGLRADSPCVYDQGLVTEFNEAYESEKERVANENQQT